MKIEAGVPNDWKNITVLSNGFVRLDGCEATDLSVVNSARVSYGMRREEVQLSDEKLISYLMKNKHGTPFEHNMFRFHIKAPIFIFREWQRHRVGSFNELSARYKELEPEWYVPAAVDVRKRVGRPGHYTYERAKTDEAHKFRSSIDMVCRRAFDTYRMALASGIAPELARLCLPVATYSEMYWTVNARSLMNFLNLRNAATAQYEIQQYAIAVEHFFSFKMPVTYKAFIENKRVAP
jgi:thymidylate synthase (FAD)